MEIRFNVTGAERKNLVSAVSGIVGCESVYMKAPSFAYTVGNYTIDKNGTLIFDERVEHDGVHTLLKELAGRGFVSEDTFGAEDPAMEASAETDRAEEASTKTASVADVSDRLVIEMPMDGFTATALYNLEKLVESKAALIMKAIGTDAIPVEREDGRLRFPWFSSAASPEDIGAYTQFIHALCEMAKKQKRVTAKEKPADSEKFAFRCFLLRLGFIGDEYAAARKILLAKLSGDSSFKNGKRKDQAEIASDAANAADSGTESGAEANAGEGELRANDAATGAEKHEDCLACSNSMSEPSEENGNADKLFCIIKQAYVCEHDSCSEFN